LLPAVGLLAVAWPHYAINGTRYLGYARATAEGFAFEVWPETGFAFAARVARVLVADVLGPAGAVTLAAGIGLLPFAWRRADETQRLMAALTALAASPTALAFLLSRNQTDRYLGLSVVCLTVVVAVGVGGALRAAAGPRRAAGAFAGAIGAATLAQIGWALFIAWQGPVSVWPGSGLSSVSWRENGHCDFAELPSTVPPVAAGPTKIGVFGASASVNDATVRMAFLRAGRRVSSFHFGMYESEMDWDAVVAEAAHQDALVVPMHLEAAETFQVNRFIPEFEARLAAGGVEIGKRVEIAGGPSPACAVRVLIPVPGTGPRTGRGPFRSEVNTLP
jgi:hypothetical protein